jgi:hypothetical protein
MKKLKKILFAAFLNFILLKAAWAQEYVYPNVGLPENPSGIAGILANILDWLLLIIGIVAVIAFVISGLQYLLSAGDEKSMETAKRNVVYSIIGVVAALSGYVIVRAVDTMLRGGVF